ncbi:Major facilitator superfamily domain general substrate transporter [Penicillium robsamsonii]|uniref:Major facilitator superfamily domain general substrate transporter n=1 Tax=Penicillium robsamsonii TaxID=1792511 RepID=UPI002546A77A|nr:Major facilitator superfamily domain general substrate transporter [Penicillium robsamsonii]KAJ5835252.1 Major facilitator superfamily domain general substrate transporter [Penicillium robsamsonii]
MAIYSIFSDFYSYYSQWKHGKVLLAITLSWFSLDIAFYHGLDLNSIILAATNWTVGKNVYDMLYRNAVGNLILICAGAIPGYLVTIAIIDKIGRKRIQLLGFLILFALFAIIGLADLNNNDSGPFSLYVLTQFCFNFGPVFTYFSLNYTFHLISNVTPCHIKLVSTRPDLYVRSHLDLPGLI